MNQEVRIGELDFNGNLIQLTQGTGFDMMVNATEMWKSFGREKNKQPYEFLRLLSTKKYLKNIEQNISQDYTAISSVRGNYSDNRNQGTWIHEYIAIQYAKWLDPSIPCKLVNNLVETRIKHSPERIISYNKEDVLEYFLDLVDILGIKLEENESIDIVNDGLGITRFILGNSVEFTKSSLLSATLKIGNKFILRTIDMLSRNFIEKSDEELVLYSYYILPTVLDNLSYSRVSESKNQKTYLMKDSNTGYTKIGKSINPRFRERTLQSEKPSISLFAICETLVESELHNKYKDKRVRGEWFDLGTGDIEEIVKKYKFIKSTGSGV